MSEAFGLGDVCTFNDRNNRKLLNLSHWGPRELEVHSLRRTVVEKNPQEKRAELGDKTGSTKKDAIKKEKETTMKERLIQLDRMGLFGLLLLLCYAFPVVQHFLLRSPDAPQRPPETGWLGNNSTTLLRGSLPPNDHHVSVALASIAHRANGAWIHSSSCFWPVVVMRHDGPLRGGWSSRKEQCSSTIEKKEGGARGTSGSRVGERGLE